MAKKEDIIIMRIGKEFKTFLQNKAKEKGVSLSKLIEERLHDTFKQDKELILDLIDKRKQERPVYWKELEKSPIIREFENYIASLFTEFVNPLSKDPNYQPLIILNWIEHILSLTIKHFDSISEEHKKGAADSFISIGEKLIDGLTSIQATDKETQEYILKRKKEFVEKAIYYYTALAFAKESYHKIKRELEKVNDELIKELKENSE